MHTVFKLADGTIVAAGEYCGKLEAENAALRARADELERTTKPPETRARQKLPGEMDPEDAADGDYIGSYECIVRDARAALED